MRTTIALFIAFYSGLLIAADKRPVSLTLSGGVSLAAYETGFVYYLGRHLNDGQMSDLKIVTGASAGSINGVVAIVNACAAKVDSPQKSVNWRAWMPLGIKDIADPAKVTALSIFSRDGVGQYTGLLRSEFLAGLRADCDVVLGVAVTRKVPLKVEIKPGLTTDRHNEFILLRIKGRGPGKPPLIENFPLNIKGERQIFLPLTGDPKDGYDRLEEVFTTSAQFPFAFPAYPLNHCDFDSTAAKDSCTFSKAKKVDFIDGGLFDNTPVKLANTIAERFLSKKDRANLIYSVITLDGGTHPVPSTEDDKRPSVLKYMANLAGQFTETARNRSVSEIYLNPNGVFRQTFSNDKLLPRSSQYYFAFSGFLDRGFREYDFYLGMLEARHYFQIFIKTMADGSARKYLGTKLDAEYAHLDDPEWRPFFCLLETYEADTRASGACGKMRENKSFTALLKVNSEIVKNRCDGAGEKAREYPSCRMTADVKSESKFLDGESDQRFFYRRLEEMKYPYELASSRSSSGEDILRERIEPLLKIMVKKQPRDQRLVMGEATKILLNSLDYKPQNNRTRFGLGGHVQAERGHMLWTRPRRPWIFFDYGLMVRGLDTLLNTNPNALALAPFAGLSANFTSRSFFWFEPEIGVRGGYNHSFENNNAICDAQEAFQSSLYCRSAFFQPHISVGILSRARFEIGSIIYASKKYKADLTLLAQFQF